MTRSTEHVPDVPDLMARAHVRAARVRRRRTGVAATGLALALVAAAGIGTLLQSGRDPDEAVTVQQPAPTSSSPTPTPFPAATGPATPDPSVAPTAPATRRPATGNAHGPTSTTGAVRSGRTTSAGPTARRTTAARGGPTATRTATGRAASGATGAATGGAASGGDPLRPAGPWSTVQVDEGFTATTLDRARWTPYAGTSGSPETTWSPQQISVQNGALRLTVDRVGETTPVARAGGIKQSNAGQRYGRWELRWRMTAGYGVTGDFLFLGEGPGGIGQVATLSSADRLLTISDKVRGTSREISLDGTRYHVVAMESSPQRVRWFVDGRVVVDEAGGAPTIPTVAGVQALVPGADCGRTPLPSGCRGAAAFPQYLDVDYLRFWPYQA
jgi:hypothetical protein